VLGGSSDLGLDNTTNQLSYPNSTFINVQDGMPDSSSVYALAPALTSSTTPSAVATSAALSLAKTESDTSGTRDSGPICNGGVCGTYEYKSCPRGCCACGLDANNKSICLLNDHCSYILYG
jgi:hypothetical protein